MNNVTDNNVFASFRDSKTKTLKLRFLLVIVFGFFFYSAGIYILLRGLSTIMLAEQVTLLNFLHLFATAIPPLLIGFGLLTLRHWSIYVLVAHVTLAALSVLPLWYFGLSELIGSTLSNNLVILAILLVMISLSSELYKSRYGILLTVLYVLLLTVTSGTQIYYRLQL
jgi:hypothetical protein